MIYLYAITDRPPGPLAVHGIAGASIEALEVESLVAIYSAHECLQLRADPDLCWAHEQVVEPLMQTAAVLPARFGTTFDDVGALRRVVQDKAPALREQLDQVRGCVEVAVTAVRSRQHPESPAEETPASPAVEEGSRIGQTYLLERLRTQREGEELLRGTLAPLTQCAVLARPTPTASSTGIWKVSYLVRAAEVRRFSEEVVRLQQENRELTLTATGPWPPYSFAAGEQT